MSFPLETTLKGWGGKNHLFLSIFIFYSMFLFFRSIFPSFSCLYLSNPFCFIVSLCFVLILHYYPFCFVKRDYPITRYDSYECLCCGCLFYIRSGGRIVKYENKKISLLQDRCIDFAWYTSIDIRFRVKDSSVSSALSPNFVPNKAVQSPYAP